MPEMMGVPYLFKISIKNEGNRLDNFWLTLVNENVDLTVQ
jgi:hypothetical protein